MLPSNEEFQGNTVGRLLEAGKPEAGYYGKIEYNRYYTHEDPEVKQGIRKRGQEKEGNKMHAKLIVSRKMADNSRLISPMTNHRGSNTGHSQKFGQFDRLNFTNRCKKAFDRTFSYERELSETIQYRKVMLNGSAQERADMIVVERNQALQHNKRKKKELMQQPKIKSRQEQHNKKGSGF